MTRFPERSLPIVLMAVLGLTACNRQQPPTTSPSTPAPASAPRPTPPPSWSGRWNGPEGTYLQITPLADGRYRIAVRNLDGERSFDGSAGEGGLPPRFERDGQAEQLRPTDGAGTGMKWLDGKRDCLVVRPGEGYCRD